LPGKTPEEVLEEARKLIGYETKPYPIRSPVEYSSILRHCMMTHNDNPLFLDPEYARNTKYSAVVAPAFFYSVMEGNYRWPGEAKTPEQTLPEVPTPGQRLINLATEWEIFKPAKIGDSFTASQRIKDVYTKPTRLDPKSFWIVTERIYRDQNGETAAICSNIALRYRSPEEIEAAGNA